VGILDIVLLIGGICRSQAHIFATWFVFLVRKFWAMVLYQLRQSHEGCEGYLENEGFEGSVGM